MAAGKVVAESELGVPGVRVADEVGVTRGTSLRDRSDRTTQLQDSSQGRMKYPASVMSPTLVIFRSATRK